MPEGLRRALGFFALDELIVTSEGVGFADGGLWMTNLCLEDDCRRTRWAVIRINEAGPEARETAPPLPLPAASWGGKLRAGPGTDYPQTGSLAEGERVTLLERTSVLRDGLPWFLIELSDGHTGYQWGGILCGLEVPVEGTFEVCGR
ncbi:MAG: SH3 domain-containing protein [Tistlia sp.]|uniref:SH3 domain-containing protein n=1 Tax=Tistlia sp. TaxID=3057121 RepID=UPI0034A496AC